MTGKRIIMFLRHYSAPIFFILSLTLTGCTNDIDVYKTDKQKPGATKHVYRNKIKLTTTNNNPEKLIQLKKSIQAIHDKKLQKARNYLLPLTQQKYADAYFYMAYTYMPQRIIGLSNNLSFNWRKGIPWLKKAADAGHADAQLSMSEWLTLGFSGHSIYSLDNTDWKSAYKYARMSANQGYAAGQSWLARLLEDYSIYLEKQGIEKNEYNRNINIYMWYTLASHRYEPRKRKNIIINIRNKFSTRNKLSKSQIEISLKKSTNWENTHIDSYKEMYPAELYP